ncbi:MAG: hypothetical protein JNM89_03915 [Hyphomicrobiaceae bacterium]|nr:hypothetical protein [Hyphomicrobiaceae bacterium]
MEGGGWTVLGLWLAIGLSGIYHGANPAMGWPLAVSAALMDRNSYSLAMAFLPLAVGHFLAVTIALLPFALIVTFVEWQYQLRAIAALAVLAFGIYRLVDRRHSRALARIPPTQLGLWSFVVALAHGAGLMIVPIYLGLCTSDGVSSGHVAARRLVAADVGFAGLVAAVHTVAMVLTGTLMAWLAYRYLGLRFIARSWFNLDVVWALSLVAVGTTSLAILVFG